jgi:uncharacterized membrane protein YcjF (UPF0283 family)
MADIDDMDDFELNEEEQRFNNMLDGIEEEYDELIRVNDEEQSRKDTRRAIIMAVMIVIGIAIVVWAVMGFPYS